MLNIHKIIMCVFVILPATMHCAQRLSRLIANSAARNMARNFGHARTRILDKTKAPEPTSTVKSAAVASAVVIGASAAYQQNQETSKTDKANEKDFLSPKSDNIHRDTKDDCLARYMPAFFRNVARDAHIDINDKEKVSDYCACFERKKRNNGIYVVDRWGDQKCKEEFRESIVQKEEWSGPIGDPSVTYILTGPRRKGTDFIDSDPHSFPIIVKRSTHYIFEPSMPYPDLEYNFVDYEFIRCYLNKKTNNISCDHCAAQFSNPHADKFDRPSSIARVQVAAEKDSKKIFDALEKLYKLQNPSND